MTTLTRMTARLALLAAALLGPASRLNADYMFTTFSDPNDPGASVRVTGINNAGQVIGYAGSSTVDEEFVRNADGTTHSFTVPNGGYYYGAAINNSGQLLLSDYLGQQVLASNNGGSTLTTLITTQTIPLSTDVTANGLNDRNLVAGSYNDSSYNPHGMIFNAATGKVTTVDYANNPMTYGTTLAGINNSGVVAGEYYNLNHYNGYHGLIESKGVFTTFDPAGSTNTFIGGINFAGVVAGNYADANNVYHGFVRAADGTITTFDLPSSLGATYIDVTGINDKGDLSGWYKTGNGGLIGFIATPEVAVPEPSSLALMGLGLALLAARARRRSRARPR